MEYTKKPTSLGPLWDFSIEHWSHGGQTAQLESIPGSVDGTKEAAAEQDSALNRTIGHVKQATATVKPHKSAPHYTALHYTAPHYTAPHYTALVSTD